MAEVEDFLEHYGVKGMQWGVRKSARSSHPQSDDHKTAKALQSRHRSSLSNHELKTLNERRNLEQNYNRLNPSVVRRGEAHAKGVIAAVGLATALAKLADTPFGAAAIRGGRSFINDVRHPGSFGLNNIRLTT